MLVDLPKNPQVRRIGKALFLSGTLNIVLATLLFYWVFREQPPTPYFKLKPAEQENQQIVLASGQNTSELIRHFKTLSTKQLIDMLSDTQLVENGYTQRDLTLASLVTFHYFDISRALSGLPQPSQHRAIAYGVRKDGHPSKVIVYPGLSDEQFQAIIHFAQTEKWPLTARGLFLSLAKPENRHEASMADTFYMTPEFLTAETLFNRSDAKVEKAALLQVLLDGSWQMLWTFVEEQKQAQDLSPARRQRLLLQYIEKGSKHAAYLTLKTDGPFAVRRFDDAHIRAMLELLPKKTHDAEQFALALLISPRSDAVWVMAANRLYEYAGEQKPESFLHHAALARFVPKNTVVVKPVAVALQESATLKAVKAERVYIVQEGDSLWKISRLFNADIDHLKKHNRLVSDFLKPGSTLKIP